MVECANELLLRGWRVTANGRWRHERLRANTLGGNHRPVLVPLDEAVRVQAGWDAAEMVVQGAIDEATLARPCPECGAYECPGAVAPPVPAA